MVVKKDDVSIVLCGPAGQGIQTVETLMIHILKNSEYNLFATKEYMSRVRGGSNSTELRISSRKIQSYVDRIDILIPFDFDSFSRIRKRITGETVIIGEKEKLVKKGDNDVFDIIDLPLSQTAKDVGNVLYLNIIVVGILSAIFKIEIDIVEQAIKTSFQKKGDNVVQKNVEAVKKGYELGVELNSNDVTIEMQKDASVKDEIIINGGEAVAMGAIAGGCNFISSYPMTPSTSVLTFLAQQSENFDIIAEQAEDEIAAINMAIGSWYAGGRAMVTTSGGGFALMVEGVSLAAILESPIVIHLAQRPGPATGLPTRTEQGDLLFALYSGHGEFPRVIFAPGTLRDAFYLTQKAFNIADKYQIPVIVMTDQYFIDSYHNTPKLDATAVKIENYVVNTNENYQRYAPADNGVSPRGIPGHGDGLVVVDSDEHDHDGHITEDHDIRIEMVDKRLKKYKTMQEDMEMPELVGTEDYETLVVCWGSTFPIVREAIEQLDKENVAVLYFKQVYPVPTSVSEYFNKAQDIIIVEGNATAQLAHILKLYCDIDIQKRILKYNGLQFSVEELVEKLNESIK